MAKDTHDNATLLLINKVKKCKEEIARAERPNWKTNCSFPYIDGSSQTANIHVVSDINVLVGLAAYLIGKNKDYQEAAKELDVPVQEFKWGGFSMTEWMDDFKTRIAKISIATKRKQLEVMENRLNLVISPELRRQMELEAISKELEDLK